MAYQAILRASRAVRVAVDGSLPPARILRKTMSSTAGNETAKDSMDEIKAVPEQRSQGTSSPSLLGSYFEAGDEDQGEGLGTTHRRRTTTCWTSGRVLLRCRSGSSGSV